MSSEYQPIDLFDNPSELAALVDDSILSGQVKIYPWQMRIHRDFAVPSTEENPFKAVVRAANGSGKDKMAIAPCVVFLGTKYVLSNSVVTSSSGTQLDTQTDTYINQLCNGINRKFGEEIWKCNYREYLNLKTGSVINLFATDEPGRAEGAHPITHNGQMGIFASEAKTIPDKMFEAFARCNGFTKRLDVSSPGICFGHFYDVCTRKELGWKEYHITAFDCPHVSKASIDYIRLKYGESSALFRSMILAEFGVQDGELLVISAEKLHRLFKLCSSMERITEKFNTAGLDLSAGSAETVLAIRNGNKLLALEAFQIADTSKMIRHLEGLFRKYDLISHEATVRADSGGLGKPIIDQLRDRGWKNVTYVMNQWEPRDKIAYANLGTENWFRFARLVEEMEVIIPFRDDVLEKQLLSRYYKLRPDNSFILESKIQARAKGRQSPDRGDALVLAFSNYVPSYLEREHRKTQDVPIEMTKVVQTPLLSEVIKRKEKNLFEGVARQRTAMEMTKLVAEVGEINVRLQREFALQRLLEN